jgi:hypothetical protein
MCFVSGEHTLDSHKGGKGLLTVKQQVSIRTAVRCAPLQTGSAVLANLKNFSPDRRVRGDKRSKSVLDRMVRRGRKKLMAERTPGYRVYETKGAMTKLAKSLSLKTAIKRHNDPADSYHMDAHQVVCLGFQFKDGVRFMVLSTPHLIVNMARAIQCGWQIQGHWDGAFNWCNKDYGMLAFGLNNMGARYNPVTITIANSESRTAYQHSFEAAEVAFFTLYKSTRLCYLEECSFCTTIKEQAKGSLLKEYLLSPQGQRGVYNIDKQASDQSAPLIAFAKDKFGKSVLQCWQHLSGEFPDLGNSCFALGTFGNFWYFPTNKLSF